MNREMRSKSLFLLLTIAALTLTAAAEKEMQQGTIVSETSVSCGTQTKGKKQNDLMCQEYVIRTDSTEYHVRQEKEAHKAMLPMNAPVLLTLKKDKMKFQVNGKGYEMLVVSEAAVTPPAAAPAVKP